MGLRRNRRRTLGTLITSVDLRLKEIERRPAPKRIMPKSITALLIDPEDATDIRDATSSSGTIISDDPPSPDEVNPGDSWLSPQEDGSYEEKVYAPTEEDETDFDAWKPLVNEATQAAAEAAQAASVAANNSNRVFYQDEAPSNPSTVPAPPGQTGTVSYSLRKNDLWFDTNDGNKPWKWDPDYIPTGQTTKAPQWVPATFGDGAIAGLNAGKITAGVLAAGVIYSGTIAADKILAGQLGAGVIAASAINADNLTATTITGKTIRTSAGGNRVEVSTGDEIVLYRSGSKFGVLNTRDAFVNTGGNDQFTSKPAVGLFTGLLSDGPRVVLATEDGSANLQAKAYDSSDPDAVYVAAVDDGETVKNATVFAPMVDIVGGDVLVFASPGEGSGDGILSLYASNTLNISSTVLTDSFDSPATVNPEDGVYALGVNEEGDVIAVQGGGGGGTGAGYFNAQNPTEEGNQIFYNNSSSFPSAAKAGDILIWYT